MKKLKFLILVLGMIAAQGVLAVQLPSSSYSEVPSYESSGEVVLNSGVTFPKSSFLQLGTIDYNECTSKSTFQDCEHCCRQKVIDCYGDSSIGDKSECNTLSSECNDGCGRSLPLDAPLWFMLLLALGGGAKGLLPLLRKIKH